MDNFKKNIVKSIIKNSIPEEKQTEVFEYFDKLDLDLLFKDPAALLDVLSNPSKLCDYSIEKVDVVNEEGTEAGSSEP